MDDYLVVHSWWVGLMGRLGWRTAVVSVCCTKLRLGVWNWRTCCGLVDVGDQGYNRTGSNVMIISFIHDIMTNFYFSNPYCLTSCNIMHKTYLNRILRGVGAAAARSPDEGFPAHVRRRATRRPNYSYIRNESV